MIVFTILLEIILGAMFLSQSQGTTIELKDYIIQSSQGNLAMCVVFWLLAILTIVCILCMWKRIKLVTAVFKVISIINHMINFFFLFYF